MDLYRFDKHTVDGICKKLSIDCKKRRLEKSMSRKFLSLASGVPEPTITKFEQDGSISLKSFVAIIQSLGYEDEIFSIIAEPKYNTIKELTEIRKNRNRKRGKNEFNR